MVFWFTGLSGAGKTTLAVALTRHLTNLGHPTLFLDGDLVRQSLCSDLGFSMDDRRENIRRIASCAKLAEESGLTVCVACISPLSAHRSLAKSIISDFHEIYVKADLATCITRDPKGNYERKIANYTGISSRYEEPVNPSLIIDTCAYGLDESISQLKEYASKYKT